MKQLQDADRLRHWAKGNYTLEAATELVLRAFDGRFARRGWPWVKSEDGFLWIDFADIPGKMGVMSSGEARILMLAASLAEDEPIPLGDLVTGLDRENMALVLAAVSHASGSQEHRTFPDYEPLGALYQWPTIDTQTPGLMP